MIIFTRTQAEKEILAFTVTKEEREMLWYILYMIYGCGI